MKLLLVDDHSLFRGGLRLLLAALQQDLTILEADSCQSAMGLMQQHDDIRLCLLDLSLRNEDGLGILEVLKSHRPEVVAVVVSADESPTTIYAALDAGAMGYVPKSANPAVMVQALRLVLEGGIYLPSALIEAKNHDKGRDKLAVVTSAGIMTTRQQEVLQGLLRGWPNKTISRHLDISENTLKGHLAAIYRILEVRSRSQAVIAAAKHGFKAGLEEACHDYN